MVAEPRLQAALRAWPGLEGARVTPVTTGLINLTFRVDVESGSYALQRLSPIFGREVHRDIEAVTRHLAAKGCPTPRLVRTDVGDLDYLDEDTKVWRLLTWVEGICHTAVTSEDVAREAGALLGRFHTALFDFNTPLAHVRLGVHDTPRHLEGLRQALTTGGKNAPDAAVPLAEEILRAAETIPPLPNSPLRLVHGDPKVSNLLFTREGRGWAMIDLDTVARMALPLELGDAFRSWCNRSGEDTPAPRFDVDLFEAAVSGYAREASASLNALERSALVTGTRTIMVELAARFARDIFEDQYFGWDATRFPSRREHNRVRAQGQLALARDLERRHAEAERVVEKAFRSGSG